MTASGIPDGYHLLPDEGSFNDVFKPLYMTLDDNGPKTGFRVEKQHCNMMGICHGAVYMALFDNAFGAAVGYAIGKFCGTPTINININYMNASKEGEWLDIHARCLRTTKNMAFVEGEILGPNGMKASASGIFKIPNDIDAAKGMTVEEYRQVFADVLKG